MTDQEFKKIRLLKLKAEEIKKNHDFLKGNKEVMVTLGNHSRRVAVTGPISETIIADVLKHYEKSYKEIQSQLDSIKITF